MDATDLYAGLAAPKRAAKRLTEERDGRESSTDGSGAVAAASEQPPTAKKQRTDDSKSAPLDLPATVAKLKRYMLVDKKFAKASALFGQLMDEKLSAETRELFVTTLQELIAAKGSDWSGKPEFAALIGKVLAKREVVVINDADAALLDEWEFLAVTHARLFTDDTYQFAKNAKVVKLRLESTLADESRPASEQLHRVLMPVLRTLFAKHGVQWATTAVESVLNVCTRHRMAFDAGADREQVDAWTTAVRVRRSAPPVVRTAGSESRRNIVALDASNASQASAKVGRANHPLFNKEV